MIQFITAEKTESLNQTDQIQSVSLPVAIAIAQYELSIEEAKFDGLMTAVSLSGKGDKVPRSKRISKLRKKLKAYELSTLQEGNSLKEKASLQAKSFGIEPEYALSLIKGGEIIADELTKRGLLYKQKPFNFALSAPYFIDKKKADRLAELSTKTLRAVEELIRSDEEVSWLLNKGSTPLEKILWPVNPGYGIAAPVNRIDLIGGQVIEFGPTFADGFGTSQALAETWGMTSSINETISSSFRTIYEQFCLSRGIKQKDFPTVGLAYIRKTEDMKDEMAVLGNYLRATEDFNEIFVGSAPKILSKKPDIVFYYLKPSMIDGYQGNPLPEGEELVNAYGKDICIVPPLKQQLGKKAVLAIIRMRPNFFKSRLGEDGYEELLSRVIDTEIVTPETPLPSREVVIKPSSGGSCNGVISSFDLEFVETFRKAQGAYNNDAEDIWVIQPKISETISSIWVRTRKGEVIKIKNALVKQTLMVVGNQAAGAFATASTEWIIDDGGYNFPCKIKSSENEE